MNESLTRHWIYVCTNFESKSYGSQPFSRYPYTTLLPASNFHIALIPKLPLRLDLYSRQALREREREYGTEEKVSNEEWIGILMHQLLSCQKDR